MGYGEVGLRVLTRGNGGSGSLFLTPTLGAGGVTGEVESVCDEWDVPDNDGNCYETESLTGPLVGLQLEWRL